MLRVISDRTDAVEHLWLFLGNTIRRPPVRLTLWMSLFNGFLFAGMLFPVLFGGQLVHHTDASLFTYPFITLFDQRIFHGGVIWNDLSGAGFPSLYIHGYIFNPFLWMLLAVMNPVSALHWSMFVHAWLASCLLGIALRRFGYRVSAAWLGSILVPLTLWGWLFEPTIAFFLPLLGAACLAISVMDTRPRAAIAGCGCVAAVAFLSLQAHYAVLLLCAMVLLWIARRAALGNGWRMTRTDVLFVASIACGLCIGLIRIVPLLGYAILSTRQGAFLDAYISTYSIDPGYLLRFFFPSSSLPVPESYFANSPFLGIGVLVLASAGLLIGRLRWLAWSALGIWVVTLALALPSSAIYGVLKLLPGIAQLGDPTRYLIVGQLALVALAVEGLHGISGARPGRAIRQLSATVVVSSALLLGIGMLLAFMRGDIDPQNESATTLSTLFSIRNTEAAILAIGGLFTGVLLYFLAREDDSYRRWAAPVLAVACAGLAIQGYLQAYRSFADRSLLNFASPVTSILAKVDATIFPFLIQELHGTALHLFNPELYYVATRMLGVPNITLVNGIRNIAMFDHLQTKRLDALLAGIGSEYGHDLSGSDAALSGSDRLQRLIDHWHVLERLGITHVLTPKRLPDRMEIMSVLLYPEALEFDDTDALIKKHPPVTMYVYEVSGARPHLSTPTEVTVRPPDDERASSDVLDPAMRERTVIECTECSALATGSGARLSLLEEMPAFTRARVRTDARRWIVIRRQLLPGWRVHIDGKPARAAIADSVFIAVEIPEGDHEVTASFSVLSMLWDSTLLLVAPARTPWFSS